MSNYSSLAGIAFVGLLAIIFGVLKPCELIDWSWWWVVSPIWITVGATLAAAAIVTLMARVIDKKK